MCCRFGRKKPLVYCMITAAIASAGAVLFTMYDPGEDKGRLILRALKMCKEEKVNLTIPYYWQAVKKTEASVCLKKFQQLKIP